MSLIGKEVSGIWSMKMSTLCPPNCGGKFMLSIIRRGTENKTVNIMSSLYKSTEQPHLKYCVQPLIATSQIWYCQVGKGAEEGNWHDQGFGPPYEERLPCLGFHHLENKVRGKAWLTLIKLCMGEKVEGHPFFSLSHTLIKLESGVIKLARYFDKVLLYLHSS